MIEGEMLPRGRGIEGGLRWQRQRSWLGITLAAEAGSWPGQRAAGAGRMQPRPHEKAKK